jgi:cytochrome c556
MEADARMIPGLFPVGSGPDSGEKTGALPAVWDEAPQFERAAHRLVTSSAELAASAKAASGSGVAAGALAVSDACKGCHDQFREKKR